MSLRKLSEVIEKIINDNKHDEIELLKAVKLNSDKLESIYQARCNIRDEILEMLKAVDGL